MNEKMKSALQKAFEAPVPDHQKKTLFLQRFPKSSISMGEFVLSQIAFIRKGIWVVSLLLFLVALYGEYVIKIQTLWVVSSFLPLVAMLTVSECVKSKFHGMEELEMATRFSLKSVISARLTILGVFDLLAFFILLPLCSVDEAASFFRTGVYLIVPYLLTATACLWITRRFRGTEGSYGCASVALLVGGANAGGHFFADFLYQAQYFGGWLILAFILIGTMIYEVRRIMKQSEVNKWNSLLIN